MRDATADDPSAVKDLDAAHPIPRAWRPMLRAVVECLVHGDYSLSRGVPEVTPVGAATATQIRTYLADYGATLQSLPEDTWASSIAQWTGTHWDVLVDLWTAEEGRSDLVLSSRVVESSAGPRLTIDLVHVP